MTDLHRPSPPPKAPAVDVLGRKVFARDVHVLAEIGVYDHEHGRRQPLSVTVELDVIEADPVNDRLADVLDYGAIVAVIEGIAAGGHVKLVESFADQVALGCLADARVVQARVRVEKPEAFRTAAAVGAEVVIRRAF